MRARDTDLSVKPAKAGNCVCGCDCGGQCGCESRCCELECLVRPNFFCGQLLTDADLGAMVEWTRRRAALARYRDGWGVVCGLDITCSSPRGSAQCRDGTQNGPSVYVNPGYAIDCCGNDLVVCEPLRVDLSSVCRTPEDPCDPQAKPATPGPVKPPLLKVCLDLSNGDVFAVQLNLRYHEDLAQGQRAMFRSGCSDVGPCEYTRVLERPCVHLEVVPAGETYDEKGEEEKWVQDFMERLMREIKHIQTLLGQGLDAILEYLGRNPPYQLCFLEEAVCCLRAKKAANLPSGGQTLSSDEIYVGMYLLFDWMLRELQCPCASCRPDTGVPLSRALVRRTMVRGRTECKVLVIDFRIPHRRPLRKDHCRPIPEGKLDLTQFLWQSPEFVVGRLRSHRVNVSLNDQYLLYVQTPQYFDNLFVPLMKDQILTFDPASAVGLSAYVVTDPFGTKRIAAFKPTSV